MEQYDAIVIGAGQSGGPLTSALTTEGKKTALIERSRVGGTCVNWGCTPTKTMIASARVAHVVKRSVDYGVNVSNGVVDMKVVRQRKRDITDMFHEGTLNSILETEGLDLIRGEATFTGHKTLQITLNDGGTRELAAEQIFIDTGTRPMIPEITGLDDVPWYDSTSIMEIDEVPEHLLILGGGYVGLEFSQMFRRFGADVTIIQRGPQLLKREDRDVADAVREILEEDGIKVCLSSTLDTVKKTESGRIEATLVGEDFSTTLTGSHLLIAAGRRPNTDMLAMEKTGIELNDAGFIPVNDRLETSVEGIWATGDVNGGPAFTHISYDDYRILTENLFNGGQETTKTRPTPYVAFIDPELGRIGLSEKQAREDGYSIKVASMPMESVARAIEVDETRGMMKAVINAEDDRILGAAILGINGGEIMSILQLAMVTGTAYTTLRDTPFAHPTVAESLNNLFANVE